MNVERILSKLVTQYESLPVVKLAWDQQIQLSIPELPKLSPSKYIKEASLTTNQRYALLEKQHRTLEQWTPETELTVVPTVVVFQGYALGDTPSVTLTIRNISKNTQKVTLIMDEDGLFTIDKSSKRVARFPPGMSFTTTIRFRADDDNSHYHKIVFVTKNSRFVIPITALGSRGMMDAPDEIDFGSVPVKYLQTKTIPICNIGSKTARFTLLTEGPFSASPEKGIVLSKDSFNLLVSFLSDFCTTAEGGLRIKYENGEEVYINLKAEAVNSPIKIAPFDLEFEDTYIGLKANLLMTIANDSDIKVTYKWRKYISLTAAGHESLVEHVHHEGGGGDVGESQPQQTRLYSHGDSIQAAQLLPAFGDSALPSDMEPLYYDDCFAVEPPMGIIQAHSSKEIHVFFSPNRPGIYVSEMFCDITGLEERTEIRITGRGLGPKFRLGFDELDIGTIYLGGGHTYEIPVTNLSEIEGALQFDSVAGLMPQAGVKVEPKQIHLAPGHYSAFFMYFNCNGKPGIFYEELRFRAPVSGQIVNLSVRGRIAYPDMHFSTSVLEFGNLSYGYPKTAQVVVVNDSLNHVRVVLKVNRDGTERVLTQQEIIATFLKDDVDFPENPKQFGVDPETFEITPRGFQRVSVTLTPASYGYYERGLLVCTEDNEIISSIEMRGRCIPPTLLKDDSVIWLKNIYRHVPYTMKLHVRNPSDMYGIFICIPRPAAKMKIESDQFTGIAPPFETTEIDFTVTCARAGDLNGYIDLYLAGVDDPAMTFEVKCHVISAAFVDISKHLIHMGNVNVDEVAVTQYDIINKCPQAVPFRLEVSTADVEGIDWKVYPEVGEIGPRNKATITLEVKVDEAGDHACIVRAYLNQGLTFLDCKVKVRGIGCSLGICPPIDRSGRIDFGSLFLKTFKSFTYQITNHGHLEKMMEWRHALDEPPTNKPPPPPKKAVQVRQPLNKRGPATKSKKVIDLVKKPMKTVFEIEPRMQLLKPGQTMTVVIKTDAPFPKVADENYILWAYTPRATGQAKKDLLAHMQIAEHLSTAELDEMVEHQQCYDPVQAKHVNLVGLFERAALHYSSKDLLFSIDPSPSQDTFEIKNELVVTNACSLPLKAEFKTTFPFSMTVKGNVLPPGTTAFSHMFEAGESVAMIISFDGSHLRKERGSLYFESQMDVTYVDHVGREVIRLRGEVHFPGVTVDRDYIDFGVVINGTEAVQEFLVTNKCNFCVTYKMYIKPKSTSITRTREGIRPSSSFVDSAVEDLVSVKEKKKSKKGKSKSPKGGKSKSKSKSPKRGSRSKSPKSGSKSKSPKKKSKSPKKRKTSKPKKEHDPLDDAFPISDGEEARFLSTQEKLAAPGSSESEELLFDPHAKMVNSEFNLDQTSELVQFLREKMYRARMMDMMGLRDPDREIDDEMTYLQGFPIHPTTVNHVSPAEVVDIVPMAGVLQAGQTQRFTVVFYAKSDISFKTVLCCFIEGGTPAYVTVTGHSAPAPTIPVHKVTSEELRDHECKPRPTLHQQEMDRKLVETCVQRNRNTYKFTTHVRKKVTRVVPITNKAHKREIIHPTFAGRFFSGDGVISVPPMSTYDFMVTYHPLEMTRTCKDRHTGSVYFLMSNGAVTLYNFVGLATSPEPEGKINIEVRCREPWTQKLAVKNWLDHPQKFVVKNEIISQASRKTSSALGSAYENDLHEFLFLVGHDTIEVGPQGTEDYLLHFIAYREGVYSYRVTFTNKIHEFLYYDLTFKVTRPDILETINISTTVREKVKYDIMLDNPLQIEAVVLSHTTVHGARVIPKKTTIAPKSECVLNVECVPLFPGKFEGVIDIVSPELGSYPYHIVLEAKPAPIEPTTFFSTTLSVPVSIQLRITNYCTKKIDFKIELNSNVFFVKEPHFPVEKRTQGKLEVEYDPCGLGVSTANLIVSSSIGGTYEFPLHGTCALPRPEGSFLVKERQHLTIYFKNPLITKATFHVHVDPPFLLVGATPKTLELKPRQSSGIVIGLQHHVKLASVLAAAVPTPTPTIISKSKKKKKAGTGTKEKEKDLPLEPVSIALTDLPERIVVDQDWEDFMVGRLVVTCSTVPGEDGKDSVVRWTYYLQGILSDRMKPRNQPQSEMPNSAEGEHYTDGEETEGENERY